MAKSLKQQKIQLRLEGKIEECFTNVEQALQKGGFSEINSDKRNTQITAEHRKLNTFGNIKIIFGYENNNTLLHIVVTETEADNFGVRITPTEKILNNFINKLLPNTIIQKIEVEAINKIKIPKDGDDLKQRIIFACKAHSEMSNTFPNKLSATESLLAAFEEIFKIKLPLSYRQFLLIHNGWKDFNSVCDLYSCEEMMDNYRRGKEKDFITIAVEDGGDDFVANCLIIGGSEISYAKFLLDPNKKTSLNKFAIIKYEDGVEETYNSFIEFVENNRPEGLLR